MEGLDSFKMESGDEDSWDYNSPMIDLYCPNVSDQPIALQNLGLCDINVLNNIGSFNATAIEGVLDMGWSPPEPVLREDRSLPTFSSVLPESLSQSPTDFGVIEQVARFSCFRGESFGDMLNSFSIPGSASQHRGVFSGARLNSGTQGQETETNVIEGTKTFTMSTEHGTSTGIPENQWKTESFIMSHNDANRGQGNESVEAEFGNRAEPYQYEGTGQGQGTLAKGHGSKKRKKIVPDTELDQVKRAAAPFKSTKRTSEIRKKGDRNPSSNANKLSGGHGKPRPQASDAPKQEYIHVRARRGQATSSHSLAERLRREKISERMKYLQDLVPGCSKVTGKAIMLDEIINYVESLQRQVEFLSMKLASVNPGLDFDIDGDNGKSIFQSEVGAPFGLGFYSDMCMHNPRQQLSHPGTIQVSLLGTQTSSDALRRTQMTARCAGIEDSTSEVPYVRKDELCPLFRQV